MSADPERHRQASKVADSLVLRASISLPLSSALVFRRGLHQRTGRRLRAEKMKIAKREAGSCRVRGGLRTAVLCALLALASELAEDGWLYSWRFSKPQVNASQCSPGQCSSVKINVIICKYTLYVIIQSDMTESNSTKFQRNELLDAIQGNATNCNAMRCNPITSKCNAIEGLASQCN